MCGCSRKLEVVTQRGESVGMIFEGKGKRSGRSKRRGARKEGYTPGLKKGIWLGYAKWRTRRR